MARTQRASRQWADAWVFLAAALAFALLPAAAAAQVSSLIAEGVARFDASPQAKSAALPSLSFENPAAREVAGREVPPDLALPTPRFASFDGWTATIDVPPATSLYGTGEVAGPLLRNGRRVTCWNHDAYGYDDTTPHLYQSHPWVLAVRADGSSFGVLADTTYRCEINLTLPGKIIFETQGPAEAPAPVFPVIVIDGPTPQQVITRLTALTGRMPMPPKWALGYHQCRYSYYPEARVREIAAEFRARRIPCDVIWLDIDYMDGFRCFTFNPSHFPDPRGLNTHLHTQGFRTVWMIDPGIKAEPGYFVYDQGTAGNHWVQRADGSVYNGEVWPGQCVFPDYTRAETRTWWAGLYKDFLATGIDGVWNDMNEPAVFNVASKTMPLDNVHRADAALGGPGPHARYHNIYGMQMVRATRDGLAAARPDVRPFVLSRANFIGGQRYAATWTGDNTANWYHLEASIPMTLNLGLSGQPFTGPDIGGFAGNGPPGADGQLFARWMGIGAFLPFARGHTGKENIDKEPWSFGPEVEETCRRALETRFRLMPYLYTLFHEAATTGLPVARPLFFADPTDPALRSEDDSFLLGSDLLVSCSVMPDHSRAPVLPRSRWDRSPDRSGEDRSPDRSGEDRSPDRSGEVRSPDRSGGVQSPDRSDHWPELELEGERERDPNLPRLYIRPGSIIPTGPAMQRVDEKPLDTLTLIVCPDEHGVAEGTLYEDAGDGHGYKDGDYLLTRFQARQEGNELVVSVKSREGRWKPPPRTHSVTLLGRPAEVRIDIDDAP